MQLQCRSENFRLRLDYETKAFRRATRSTTKCKIFAMQTNVLLAIQKVIIVIGAVSEQTNEEERWQEKG